MNQSKLDIQKENLEIVGTINGLLPRMDLVITLGKTGYADSFSVSLNGINDDSYYVMAGLSFEYPVFSRNARTQHRRALFRREQAKNALDNLKQLVEYPAKNN